MHKSQESVLQNTLPLCFQKILIHFTFNVMYCWPILLGNWLEAHVRFQNGIFFMLLYQMSRCLHCQQIFECPWDGLWIDSWRNNGSVCWYCVQRWKMLTLGQVLTETVWITNYRYACFSEEVSSSSVVSFELVVPKVHKAVLRSYEIIFMIRIKPESSYNYL